MNGDTHNVRLPLMLFSYAVHPPNLLVCSLFDSLGLRLNHGMCKLGMTVVDKPPMAEDFLKYLDVFSRPLSTS